MAQEPDERIFDWRLVKAGEVAPLKGGHGSWVETDHPAVIACMGSAPACAANGCQAERYRTALRDARNALVFQGKHWPVDISAELAAIDAALTEPRREEERD